MEQLIRKRQKKHLFFVVSSTTGIYRVFTDINLCCQYYHELAASLLPEHSVRAGSYMWSDNEVKQFNLFYDALPESPENA